MADFQQLEMLNEIIEDKCHALQQQCFLCQNYVKRVCFSGRPQYSITQEQLRFLLEYNFSTKQMGEILGVSKRTVKRHLM